MSQQEYERGEKVRLYFFENEPLEVYVTFNGTTCQKKVSMLEGEVENCTSHALRLKNLSVRGEELGEHFDNKAVTLGYVKTIYHRTIRHADILQ